MLFVAVADASRLSEELRQEQEHAMNAERLRKALEQQVKDLQTRLDEAEGNSLKGGKRVMAKLEQRVRLAWARVRSARVFCLHSDS